jgi:serine/threonine-protein kinase RsbT
MDAVDEETSILVLGRHVLPIEHEDDVVLVRRKARSIAQARGFDAFAVVAITTATSEIARNVWRHAGRGSAVIEEISVRSRIGIRLEFTDQGPGIEDLNRVLAGGYSTVRTLGLGVSGSRRLVDEFTMESAVGKGTVVRMVKWSRY